MPELFSKRPGFRKGALVGVVASSEDATAARALPASWDLCELRIDLLAANHPEALTEAWALAQPKIVTVRDAAEGGAPHWSDEQRRRFYFEALPSARYIDVEWRNLDFYSELLNAARERGCGIIVSFHDFQGTPERSVLERMHREVGAECPGAIFKVATRTDAWEDLRTLADLVTQSPPGQVAVMGMGNLGKLSRILLAKLGSCLTYAALSKGVVTGQWKAEPLAQLLAQL